MSAHYHWLKLPAREIPKTSETCYTYQPTLKYEPHEFQVEFIGELNLGFVGHSEYLAVWKDQISKQLFYGEFTDANYYDIRLDNQAREYRFSNDAWPELFEVNNIAQFKHYIMGWKPNVWDYDPDERQQLCNALEAVLEQI